MQYAKILAGLTEKTMVLAALPARRRTAAASSLVRVGILTLGWALRIRVIFIELPVDNVSADDHDLITIALAKRVVAFDTTLYY